jgi:hypothetical protein
MARNDELVGEHGSTGQKAFISCFKVGHTIPFVARRD